MSGRVVPFDTGIHRKVQSMLAWYVSESLDAEERARVENHLAECPRCRAELALERELQSAYSADIDTPGDVDQGFAALRARIAGSAPPRPSEGLLARLRDRWLEGPRWTRWALLAQCVLVATLGGLLIAQQSPEPPYRALGGPAGPPASASVGRLIVRFRPEATEQEMRRVLRTAQARLVYGPTTTGAYVLAVPVDLETAAVEQLRQEQAVTLVEALDGRMTP
ncbi:Putative zinc-finger [Variovorax sp. HW608]|uniref:zf-HC2 domain-containing protein n=1 Tax=Variovorax sp. HW608 TaxID=1034889 RepID=UPI00081FA633|nr:zf-HC2 domain-containing protein [Variovorax sp. HW608]SCK55853.1 Putative zinc-finger [Variovorax sp. HW608]